MPPWNTHPEVRRYNPYLSDVATQFLPWAKAMRSAWAEGSAPWRDRWNGCGTPLAANGQSAAFSPLTLLALPLPLPSAFLLSAALKPRGTGRGGDGRGGRRSDSRGDALFDRWHPMDDARARHSASAPFDPLRLVVARAADSGALADQDPARHRHVFRDGMCALFVVSHAVLHIELGDFGGFPFLLGLLRNLDAGSLWLPWVFPILFLAARRSDWRAAAPALVLAIGLLSLLVFDYLHDRQDPTERIGWTSPRVAQPALSAALLGAGILSMRGRVRGCGDL